MADGSRNNPADVHRTSRTSLQFHCNPLGTTFHIQHRSIQTKVNTVSHTTTQELLKKSPRGVQRGNLCGIYGGVSAIYIMQQYILQKYTKFRLIHFGSVSNCRYRSIQTQVSFFQLSTIAALYKKGPGVCRGARPCAPLRFSYIPM